MSGLQRLPDWEPRLLAWLKRCDRLPYRWGQHDCCTFAAGAAEAQTGVDFYAPFQGRYRSARGAARVLRRAGHRDLFGPFDAILGQRVGPLLLQRGDIVSDGQRVGLMWNRAGPTGLFVGAEATEAETFETGLVEAPLSSLKWGWRIDE
jgi:hypothetical protein